MNCTRNYGNVWWGELQTYSTPLCQFTSAGDSVDREVASAPTLCRLEKWADKATAWRLREVLVDQFIASFKTAPKELVLDFDATDNLLYGQ